VAEHGVHPLDPEIGIIWPAGIEPVLSPKDAKAPTLEQATDHGLLPSWDVCRKFHVSAATGA
jgi:dTDP-4-dehydrorhamnose 3,5-epimerase